MQSYKLSNKFYGFLLINDTNISITKLSKYFYNYIDIKECSNIDKDYEEKLIIRDAKKYYEQDCKKEYMIDNHKLCVNDKDIIIFVENSEDEILFLKRFIIDYMNRIIEKNSGIFLHGSTVVNRNESIIFTGEKMSGKTTNMLLMLEKFGFNYSSNEKVALIRKDDKIYSYGCPSNINVRVGTLEYNKNIFQKLKRYIDVNEDKIKINNENGVKEKRIVFTASELSKSFDVDIKPIGIVKCICNLTFSPEVDFSIRELTNKEKLIILKRNLISGVYPTREEVLNNVINQKYSKNIEDFVNIRCYNICHNNTMNNTGKILTRVKEDLW